MELIKNKIGNNYKFSYNNSEGIRIPQFGALSAIQAFWTVEKSTATVVMPTGTGKTETMMAAIVAERIIHTIIVVPSNLLRTQTVEKLQTCRQCHSLQKMLT